MLTPAHIAASYLLSQVPRLIGTPLSSSEVIAVIVAGNILDLDFIFGTFMGRKGDDHHNFITHTPAFVFVVWTTSLILFSQYFSQFTWVVILISILLHLVLDDIGYRFCKLGWQKISKYPQINWFYPLKTFNERIYSHSNKILLKDYMTEAKVSMFFEFLLIITALLVFIFKTLYGQMDF